MLKTILKTTSRVASTTITTATIAKYMVVKLTSNICFRNEYYYGRGNKTKNNMLNQY